MAQYSSKTTTNNYTIYLLVENVDKDISGNRSKVQYRAWITGNSGTSAYSDNGQWTVSIDGVSSSGTLAYNFGSQKTWYCVGSASTYAKSGYITHNDNGTKSINVSFTFNGNSTYVGTASISQNFTLDTIERVSTLSDLTSSCYTNSSISFTINRASSSFRHSLKLSYDGSTFNEVWSEGHGTGSIQTGPISLPSAVISGVNDTAWPWVPSWFKQAMVKAGVISKGATLRLDTYSGTTMNSSTLIGSETYYITINIKVISTASYTFSTTGTSGTTHYTNSTLTITHTNELDTNILSKVVVLRTCNGNIKTDTFSGSNINNNYSGLVNTYEPALRDNTSGSVSVQLKVYGRYTENNTTTEVLLSTYVPSSYIITVNTSTYKPFIGTISKGVLNPSNYTGADGTGNPGYLAGYTGVKVNFGLYVNGSSPIDNSQTTLSITPSDLVSSYTKVSSGIYNIYINKSSSQVTLSISITVKDTRGTSATGNTTVTFDGYIGPVFSASQVKRTNSDGTDNTRGTCAYFTVTAEKGIRKSSSNSSINLSNLVIKYNNSTITGGSTSGKGPLSISGVKGSNDYDSNTNYDFIATATDVYGISNSITITLKKFAIPLSLHKNNGVGLGTLAVQGYITNGLPLTLNTPVNITHQGDVQGTTSFDGHSNITENLWVPYSTVRRNNANNTTYVYHRIATVGEITDSWYDASGIILIDQGYNGGGWGIARLILRTNNVSQSQAPSASVEWLVRSRTLSANCLQWGLYNNSGKATADVYYYATGSYDSCVIRKLESYRGYISSGRWTLVNSVATGSGATSEDTTKTEVYTGINRISYTSTGYAVEVGISGKLGSSTVGSSYQPIYLASGVPTTTNAFLRVDTSTPLSSSTGYNTINGEVKFINSGYASTGTLTDTASGIACSNKGSRYLVNELLTDGIVAPASNYTNNSFNTTGGTIAFYKYTSGSGGTYTGLTKTAEIDANGTYKPKVSRDFTFSLTALAGYSQSTTVLRFKLFIPTGYTSVVLKSYTAPTTLGAGSTSVSGSGTIALMSGTNDQNPDRGYVNVQLTTSSAVLTQDRAYVMKSGTVVLTLS